MRTVLVIGYGSIAKRHINNIIKIDKTIRILVVTKQKKIKSHKKIEFYKKIKEAIKQNPNCAIICSRTFLHLKQATYLSKNKIHLLIEKPISVDCNGIRNLYKICRKNKLILMVGYNLLFDESLIKFKKLVKQNRFGKLLSVVSEVGYYLPYWRKDRDYKNTNSAKKKYGGGVLLELSHDLNYLIWIFGYISWISTALFKKSDLNIDVEDTAYSLIGFKNNLVATLHQDFLRENYTRKCIAKFEKCTLMWNYKNKSIYKKVRDNKKWSLIFKSKHNKNVSYLDEIRFFFKNIKNKKIANNLKLSIQTLDVIKSARLSNKFNLKKQSIKYSVV